MTIVDHIQASAASSTELRQYLANVEKIMSGLNLRTTDLDAQIETLTQHEDELKALQAGRAEAIDALRQEDVQLASDLDDLHLQEAIRGKEAVRDSITARKERRAELKAELKHATDEDKRCAAQESTQLAAIEGERAAMHLKLEGIETLRETYQEKGEEFHAALGAAILKEYQEDVASMRAAIEAAAAEKEQLEETRLTARQQVIRDLAAWPRIQGPLREEERLEHVEQGDFVLLLRAWQEWLTALEKHGTASPQRVVDTNIVELLTVTQAHMTAYLDSRLIGLDRRNQFNHLRLLAEQVVTHFKQTSSYWR